ncbi:MAG: von Willebrand factor type A domain-containing protein, partial [Flavobacterium sp.]|nr:von Willebrand factor type A domain-containing protein [Flavobacterium sp.]
MKNVKIISLGIVMLITFLNLTAVKFAEQKISGVVSDALGPLAGVSVSIKGTNKKTTTDFDGKYAISANEKDVLLFSFVGYKTQAISVGKKTIINVVMEEDILTESEVVVQGYVKEERVIFDDKAPKVKAISNNYTALQGQVYGVSVTPKNGTPGNSNVIIRGVSSIDKKQEPIYIIDGKPARAEDFRKLNPNDIEKVIVLKDEKSTALYGNRGKNGAVTIITRNGLPIEKKDKLIKEIAPFDNSIPSIEPNQEDYELFVENQFTSPKSEPLSTFSIDVDNASYTNIRRFINQGQTVPKDAVRVEEMVNFFKYNYEKPTGNHPFAIATEYGECPWNEKHKLVKIGLQGKEIPTDELPNSNFVFLIDVSGSMNSQNKLPLLKESMKVLVNQLRKKDKVAIVVYAGAAGLVLPPTSGDEKETIIKALDNLSAGGSTAGGAGIELAYKIASENFIKGGNNRVILATDGDFNVGVSSNKDMETLIEEKRKSGVFLTCLGYGMGNYKDSKMETLANKGNGNYAYIDNIQEANRFLGKEFKGSMFAIAKDVKIQIEFNPKHVQSYRLIGYENRKLRPEDFKNDAIDAGELGSGHTVTALYEIIPTGVESAFNQDIADLKYSEIKIAPKDYSDELATIKFRYKKPDGEKSIEMVETIKNNVLSLTKTSDDFKFSAAVAWFGLKLRDSKLVT